MLEIRYLVYLYFFYFLFEIEIKICKCNTVFFTNLKNFPQTIDNILDKITCSSPTKVINMGGHDTVAPSLISSSCTRMYHVHEASFRPYTQVFNFQMVSSVNTSIGSFTYTSLLIGLPCRNAAFISMELHCHPLDAIIVRTSLWHSLEHVGESV